MLQRSTQRALSSLARANAPTTSTRLAPVFAQRWQRQYSIHADHAVQRGLEIEPSKLSITKTTTPKTLEKNEDLIFGHSFTGAYLYQSSPAVTQWLIPDTNRPHALNRMDSFRRLAQSSYNSLPEPLPRPGNLRLPLRIHLF